MLLITSPVFCPKTGKESTILGVKPTDNCSFILSVYAFANDKVSNDNI